MSRPKRGNSLRGSQDSVSELEDEENSNMQHFKKRLKLDSRNPALDHQVNAGEDNTAQSREMVNVENDDVHRNNTGNVPVEIEGSEDDNDDDYEPSADNEDTELPEEDNRDVQNIIADLNTDEEENREYTGQYGEAATVNNENSEPQAEDIEDDDEENEPIYNIAHSDTDEEGEEYERHNEGNVDPNNDNDPENNQPPAGHRPEINVSESDLETDEDDEDENVGPQAALFQGIQENLGMNVPLDSHPTMTAMDQLLVTLAEAVRFNSCYEQVISRLRFIKKSFPHINIPTNKNALWKTLGRDRSNLVTRLYCCKCKEKIATRSQPRRVCGCGACGPGLPQTDVGTFIQLLVQPQLSDLLKLPNISEALRYRDTRVKINPNAIEDIYDGFQYKELREDGKFLSNPNNFSLTLWTDGVKVSESSNAVAFPIVLQLNELSPFARKKHMILAGIWVGNKHPDINKLLIPIVRDLLKLYNEGVRWFLNRQEIISRFIVLIFTSDAVAKAMVLMMKQYNGKFGCTLCLNPGKYTNNRRVYLADPYPMRTNQSIRRDALTATIADEVSDINGVKGFTALGALPEFDLVDGQVVDGMHNSLLGVGKQFITMILTDFGLPWYVGDPQSLARINSRLLSIKPPTKISRRPRDIQLYSKWKASEWRNWIIYYSLPCLDRILHNDYLKHWVKFCQATYIYNSSSITEADLNLANDLMISFVREFRQYGILQMTYNVHFLIHQNQSVRNWGPLWAYSTFPFESLNRNIVNNITSPYARAQQIVTRYCMKKFITLQSATANITIESKEELSLLLKLPTGKVPAGMVQGNYIVGEGNQIVRLPTTQEINLLGAVRILLARETHVTEFKKAIIHGVHYQIDDNINRTFCNSIAYCRSGFWMILRIITYNNGDGVIGGFIGKRFKVGRSAFTTRYIKLVELSRNIRFIPYQDVISPAIRIESQSNTLLIPLSSIWETD